MITTNQLLLEELREKTNSNLLRSKAFDSLSDDKLNYKPGTEQWSILECIEHLNRYGDFYIPEFKKRIASAAPSQNGRFKSSWLGEHFAQSVADKPKLNKMNTFKSMNPIGSDITKEHLKKFQEQQGELLNILENCEKIDLIKTKSAISISNWLKIRIGDALRVVIYHNERHLSQAERVLAVTQDSASAPARN
ncbi:MAG: DinB family protein [Salibacteraceae bacterium]